MKLLRPLLHATLWLALPFAALAVPQPVILDADRSTIAIDVKATVDSFTAQVPVTDVALLVDPAALENTKVRAVFQFIDVKTGKPDRDEAMHVWQDTKKFPTVIFDLKLLTPQTDGTLLATADFTLHGQTKRLTFPVKLTQADGTYQADGEAVIDTRDYGLPIIRKFALLKVAPELRVRFHLVGRINGV